jgi:hypothetical protein
LKSLRQVRLLKLAVPRRAVSIEESKSVQHDDCRFLHDFLTRYNAHRAQRQFSGSIRSIFNKPEGSPFSVRAILMVDAVTSHTRILPWSSLKLRRYRFLAGIIPPRSTNGPVSPRFVIPVLAYCDCLLVWQSAGDGTVNRANPPTTPDANSRHQ